jgi:hypothetical protein
MVDEGYFVPPTFLCSLSTTPDQLRTQLVSPIKKLFNICIWKLVIIQQCQNIENVPPLSIQDMAFIQSRIMVFSGQKVIFEGFYKAVSQLIIKFSCADGAFAIFIAIIDSKH